jgi:PAS domain S-box-containing protein
MTSMQVLSILLLLLGVGLAFSNIRLSGWILGWILLAGALLVQGFRTILGYTVSYSNFDPAIYQAANDWMGLGFALLIVASMYLMREVIVRHKLADERLRVIGAAANDAIILMDSEGYVAFWNAAAQRLFGYAEQEALDKKIESLIVSESQRAEFTKGFETFSNTGKGWNIGRLIEFSGTHKDGSAIVTEHSISGVCVEGKWYAICIIRGITERRLAEEARANLVARLESLSDRLATFQEEERHRIGYELDEAVAQQLAALRLELFMVKPPYTNNDSDAHRKAAISIAEQTLLNVREMSMGLRPPLLNEMGLTSALRWHASRQAKIVGWKININAPESVERPPLDIERACYHILREALSNIAHYANASEVWVELSQQGNTLEMRVRDNGDGFSIDLTQKRGESTRLGLLGMELRAKNAGGQLTITSAPGAGTEVHATFPLHEAAAA